MHNIGILCKYISNKLKFTPCYIILRLFSVCEAEPQTPQNYATCSAHTSKINNMSKIMIPRRWLFEK